MAWWLYFFNQHKPQIFLLQLRRVANPEWVVRLIKWIYAYYEHHFTRHKMIICSLRTTSCTSSQEHCVQSCFLLQVSLFIYETYVTWSSCNFCFHKTDNIPESCNIRIMAVFKNVEDARDIVRCCPNHVMENADKLCKKINAM